MKLTESQARRAVRKWLFEFATDSGVSHRMSTDDKIAGKLGDDRENQPASMIPDEIPIAPLSQMANQLSVAAPPVEDPDFVPGTVEELGKSVDQLSQVVPHEEIAWFYGKFQELADEAVEKGMKINILDEYEPDQKESNPTIRPAQKASQESANESWKRWANMLMETLGESRYNRPGNMTQRMKNKKLTPQDLALSYNPEDDEFENVTQEMLEDMAEEFGEEDLSTLPGFDPSRHSRTRTSAQIASGDFDGEAKLRELVSLGIYPSVRTISGLRKKIKAEIDPVVQMMVTARPAFDWLTGFYDDKNTVDWNGKKISGPDIYKMALDAYIKQNKNNPEKSAAMADAIDNNDMYKEAMAEIVMAPIIRRWIQEVKAGTIDVSSRKKKNNFTMSQWILDEVLNSGFGKSGSKRRAKKLETSMNAMNDFMAALELVAAENEEMDMSEES